MAKIGKKTRSKNWRGNENHKAKKRADLERYRQRLQDQGGRTCAVDDCFKRATGSGRYCSTHTRRYSLTGNPEGTLLKREHYGEYVRHVERIWKAQPEHPGTVAAVRLLEGWLEAVMTAHDSINGAYRHHAPAELFGLSVIQQGTSGRQLLLEGAAAYAWAFNVGKCYEVEHEMAMTVTYAMMSAVKRPVNSKGNGRDWRISERREIAGFIHKNLFRYYAAVSEGVRLMLEADKARKEAMRAPFDLSNLENDDGDTEEEADSGETQACS